MEQETDHPAAPSVQQEQASRRGAATCARGSLRHSCFALEPRSPGDVRGTLTPGTANGDGSSLLATPTSPSSSAGASWSSSPAPRQPRSTDPGSGRASHGTDRRPGPARRFPAQRGPSVRRGGRVRQRGVRGDALIVVIRRGATRPCRAAARARGDRVGAGRRRSCSAGVGDVVGVLRPTRRQGEERSPVGKVWMMSVRGGLLVELGLVDQIWRQCLGKEAKARISVPALCRSARRA